MSQEGNVHAELNPNIPINEPINWLWVFSYCIIISLLFLLICTRSSPLYPFNDWMDSNAYFTVGKGMMNGLIPYRDLFEQKGPLLYLIHGLAYLISNTTFLGIFIFEVVSFSVFLYYCHKIIMLFLDIKYSIVSLPLIAAIVLNMRAFSYGDSAEEWCIPLITISLFYLLDYFKNVYPKPIDNQWVLITGFLAGCVLWIKFTVLGFWIGWVFAISIKSLFNKEYLRLVKSWAFFFSGIFLATLPWIFYFGINSAISDWLETYLYVNTVYYSASLSFMGRFICIVMETAMGFGLNPIFSFLFIIGILYFIREGDFIEHRIGKIGLLLCVVFALLGTYGGGKGYIYYFLIFAPFLVLGLMVIGHVFGNKFGSFMALKNTVVAALLIMVIAWPLTLRYNHNAHLLGTPQQDLVQYRFAAAMNEGEGRTLLNYGSLDMGLYTVTNITPNVTFFYKPAIDYSRFPLILDEQNSYIKEKAIDYVVMIQPASQDAHELKIPGLYDNYELVMEYRATIDMDKYLRGNAYTDIHYLLFKVR